MDVNLTTKQKTLDSVCELANKNLSSYVCVSNVHMCMEVFDSHSFSEIVNGADLVIPDGRPIYWAQKLLGHKHAEQVRGQDIMNALCEASGPKGINCLTISEPIEPAAPVTRIRLPLTCALI